VGKESEEMFESSLQAQTMLITVQGTSVLYIHTSLHRNPCAPALFTELFIKEGHATGSLGVAVSAVHLHIDQGMSWMVQCWLHNQP
jgi:hypothetical protein